MKHIAVLALLAGCSVDISPTAQYIAPELTLGTVQSYLKEFCNYCECKDRTQFIVLVGRLPTSASDSAIGTCTQTPGGGVYILLEKWLQFTDMRRRIIVAHELAHCELGRKHAVDNWLMQGNGVTDWELKDKTIENVYEAACGFKR